MYCFKPLNPPIKIDQNEVNDIAFPFLREYFETMGRRKTDAEMHEIMTRKNHFHSKLIRLHRKIWRDPEGYAKLLLEENFYQSSKTVFGTALEKTARGIFKACGGTIIHEYVKSSDLLAEEEAEILNIQFKSQDNWGSRGGRTNQDNDFRQFEESPIDNIQFIGKKKVSVLCILSGMDEFKRRSKSYIKVGGYRAWELCSRGDPEMMFKVLTARDIYFDEHEQDYDDQFETIEKDFIWYSKQNFCIDPSRDKLFDHNITTLTIDQDAIDRCISTKGGKKRIRTHSGSKRKLGTESGNFIKFH